MQPESRNLKLESHIPMNEMIPTIEVELLYQIEKGEVRFDKELMVSDFVTEMNRVIEEFCKQNNLIEL